MLIFSAMKKPIITTLLALFLTLPVFAGNTASSCWLLINSYPEIAAKGAATGAVFYGITSAGSNPAAIAEMENVDFAVMHNIWLQGVTAEKLSFGKSFEAGNFAVEFLYNNLGSLPVILADQYGNPVLTTGIVSPYAWAASLVYAKKIKDFSLGMALKLLSEDLSDGASYTGCADVGFIYDGIFGDKVAIGVSLLNISTGSGSVYTPIDLKGALKYTFSHGGSPVLDAVIGCDYLIKEGYVSAQAGFDYYLFNLVTLRGGISVDGGVNVAFSAGAALKLEGMTLAYSYEPDGGIGDAHKVSLNASFGRQSASSENEDGGSITEKGTFASYMESGDFYYNEKQYRKALKYYEYINLMYWKDIEDKPEKVKSAFFQKLGICYYNIKEPKRATSNFERALYFDKENEILKHWIKSLK